MKRILFLGGLVAALLQAAPAAAVCSAANTYRYSFNGAANVAMKLHLMPFLLPARKRLPYSPRRLWRRHTEQSASGAETTAS